MKSLGKQNRLLFNEMLIDYQENKEYIKAIDTKGKSYSAGIMYMALIFEQQKIN